MTQVLTKEHQLYSYLVANLVTVWPLFIINKIQQNKSSELLKISNAITIFQTCAGKDRWDKSIPYCIPFTSHHNGLKERGSLYCIARSRNLYYIQTKTLETITLLSHYMHKYW